MFTSTAIATDKKDLVMRFLAGFSKGIDDYNATLVDKTMSEADTAKIVAMIHKYVYADARAIIDDVLARIKLSDFRKALPRQLSGG